VIPSALVESATSQSKARVPLVVPEDKEANPSFVLLEYEVIWKRRKVDSPQAVVDPVKSFRVLQYRGHRILSFGKESVAQLATTLRVIERQSGPEVPLDATVIDNLHPSPAERPLDLVPSASYRWIFVQFLRTTTSFGNTSVIIGQDCREGYQKFRCQGSTIPLGQFQCAALNLFQLHGGKPTAKDRDEPFSF
jgi:hypothetical protein